MLWFMFFILWAITMGTSRYLHRQAMKASNMEEFRMWQKRYKVASAFTWVFVASMFATSFYALGKGA